MVKLYARSKMSSKDDSSVTVINKNKSHRDEEPTSKVLREHEAEKGVGAFGANYKDSKAPGCDCLHRFLPHVVWAMLVPILISFTISQIELSSIRQSYSSTRPYKETHGTAAMSTSLSQGTSSSPPFPSSQTTPVASVIVTDGQCPSLNEMSVSDLSSSCSKILSGCSELSNSCSGFLGSSIAKVGAVTVTIVRKIRDLIFHDRRLADFSL